MWVTIFLVISIILLATSMILSTMSSNSCQKMDTENARKQYVWATVAGGAAMMTVIVALIIYLYVSTSHLDRKQ